MCAIKNQFHDEVLRRSRLYCANYKPWFPPVQARKTVFVSVVVKAFKFQNCFSSNNGSGLARRLLNRATSSDTNRFYGGEREITWKAKITCTNGCWKRVIFLLVQRFELLDVVLSSHSPIRNNNLLRNSYFLHEYLELWMNRGEVWIQKNRKHQTFDI